MKDKLKYAVMSFLTVMKYMKKTKSLIPETAYDRTKHETVGNEKLSERVVGNNDESYEIRDGSSDSLKIQLRKKDMQIEKILKYLLKKKVTNQTTV